jgi:hypothetical protein
VEVVVVANLDCEVGWAGGPALPAPVRAKIAALGTMVRAVVPDGAAAALVLPGPVERARIGEAPGGPRWRIVDAAGAPAGGPWTAWGGGGEHEHVDVDANVDVDVDVDVDAHGAPAAWRALLPRIPPPPADVLRRVADRRWALAHAERLGAALPGARAISSVDALVAHLAAGGTAASPTGAWVAKAPITAAGRDRVHRAGAAPPDDATRRRLERLLARAGALVVEPWVDRLADLGQPGIVAGPGRVVLLPPHRLLVDAGGGFAGIAIDDAAATGLSADERARVRAIAAEVGAALAGDGYRGPFTIDAFAWRDPGGVRRLHPLCEVNPRLTFGLVARAWAERLGRPLTLRVGRAAPPPGAIALVQPTAADPTAAWLEPA